MTATFWRCLSICFSVCLAVCLSLSLSLFLSLRLSVSLLSLSSKRGLPPCPKPPKSYHPTLAAQPIHTLLSPAFAGNGAADLALLQWSAGPIPRSSNKLQNLKYLTERWRCTFPQPALKNWLLPAKATFNPKRGWGTDGKAKSPEF